MIHTSSIDSHAGEGLLLSIVTLAISLALHTVDHLEGIATAIKLLVYIIQGAAGLISLISAYRIYKSKTPSNDTKTEKH